MDKEVLKNVIAGFAGGLLTPLLLFVLTKVNSDKFTVQIDTNGLVIAGLAFGASGAMGAGVSRALETLKGDN